MSLKVDLIELMESKILIVVLSVIMFIGLAMITLSYSTIENGVLIKNLTVNDITVSEITINVDLAIKLDSHPLDAFVIRSFKVNWANPAVC